MPDSSKRFNLDQMKAKLGFLSQNGYLGLLLIWVGIAVSLGYISHITGKISIDKQKESIKKTTEIETSKQ